MSKLMSSKLVFAKIYLIKTGIRDQISNTMALLRHISTSETLIAFRFKNLHCRAVVKILIHIKYLKNVYDLGIARNSERTRKNIPVHNQDVFILKMWSTAGWKASCRRIFFHDIFKDTNTSFSMIILFRKCNDRTHSII